MSDQSDDEGDRTETPSGDASSQQDGYKVGYGRPPKTHSFKKGHSGNPSGRPKRDPINLERAVNDTLAETMTVRAHGKEKRMTSLEGVLWSQMQAALQGKLSAVRSIVRLAKKTRRFKTVEVVDHVLRVPDPDQEKMLRAFYAMKGTEDPHLKSYDRSTTQHEE